MADWFTVKAADVLPGDDMYLVSNTGDIVALRDGKTVKLTKAEAERVRRWVVGRSGRTSREGRGR